MASKANPQCGDRSRVRVVVVDFEGPSNDLQQLAQTLVNAVKAPQPVMLTLPAPTNGHAALALPARQNGEGPGHFDQIVAAEPTDAQSEAEAPAIRPTNQPRKRKKLRTPVPISELDLTSGPKPFKDYFEEQAPKTDSKRYLVIAQWLKEHRNMPEIGANHVYTCYRLLSMTVPEDVLSVFRSLKKQKWVEAGSGPGLFKINHVGENQLILAKN